MADRDDFDSSMFLGDYWNDARDDFHTANQALLALEKDPSQRERLNEVFRAVHTLKSSSAMLEFHKIAGLAHFTEDVLDRLRSGELPLNQSALDLLLEAIDALETMVKERVGGASDAEQAPATTALLEELRRKVAALEAQELLAHQAVIVIDSEAAVVAFNPAGERMFGRAAAEVIGHKLELLIPGLSTTEPGGFFAGVLRGDRALSIGNSQEAVGLRNDGSAFPLELVLSEVNLGGRPLFIVVVRELSKRQARVMGVQAIERTENIRVNVNLLDSLFNLVGELIITRNRIQTIVADRSGKDLRSALATMDRLVNELQDDVSAARLVPVDEVFKKFPRMVRDLALEQHKEIDLVLEGRQIELDKAVLDSISEPLVHLLRNAVDHGVETPEERQRGRKPRRGTVRLSARRVENQILIEVSDDGGGMDTRLLKEVALRRGILSPEEAAALPEDEVLDLVFRPGFSSAREVTDLSGRGVGLDAVKTAAERMGGTVILATEPGRGTRFTLRLPLATAIIQTLMVSVGGQVFAIPSDSVLETVDLRFGQVKGLGAERVLVLRGEVIRFVPLHDLLGLSALPSPEDLIAVIIHRGDDLLGLGVDSVLDQMENIIKPFDPIAQQVRGFSGGTILGDGRVALLLDIPALL